MSQYFPKPYEPFRGDINVKVDLSNHSTKADLWNGEEFGAYKLTAKSDLASLNAEIDKADADKWKTVPDDLSKLSNVVVNKVVKKTMCDKLVSKINNSDTSGFVLKTKYDTDKKRKLMVQTNKYLTLKIYLKKTDYKC